MHILIFTDQHTSSLGGVQVSIGLQRRFLEALGHRVTVCAPALHRPHDPVRGNFDLRSIPLTRDREYSALLPSRGLDRRIDRGMAHLEPVDVVHVQGDYWGAILGYRFAERHGLPVVHTMHNHMEFGIEQVVPFPRLAIRALLAWQRLTLRPRLSRLAPSAWSFLAEYGLRAREVTAPSGHFARLLERNGVAPRVERLWNGVDDDLLDAVLATVADGAGSPEAPEAPEAPGASPGASRALGGFEAPGARARPVLIWLGRMSPEKRLMEFLEAVRQSDVEAEIRLYGAGLLLAKAEAFVREHGLGSRVRFMGAVPYPEALRAIASADALVQTSIGFDTQGMTVFEAAALGTVSIVSDPNIAGELPEGTYLEPADATVPALAEAIRSLVAAVDSGRPPRVAPQASAEFRQSFQTDRMMEVYERAIAAGPRARGAGAADDAAGEPGAGAGGASA